MGYRANPGDLSGDEKAFIVVDLISNEISKKDEGDEYRPLAIFPTQTGADSCAEEKAKKYPGRPYLVFELKKRFQVAGLIVKEVK